jgi:ribose transport system substrate-binding protein
MTAKTAAVKVTCILLLVMAILPIRASARVIGVTLLTNGHQFYRDLESGLRSEADKSKFDLIVLSAEFDAAKQDSQIRDFVAKKVDAIVVAPCNSQTVGASLSIANAAGIPVFTVDIANASKQGSVVSHIGSDNIDGGRKSAELLVKALDGTGKVIVINHPGITSALDRVKGFREVMAKYPNIQVIADIPAWGQRDRAMAVMEDMLLKVNDIAGVFAINDDCALGVLAATEAAGKKVMIVGYDATPQGKKAIAEGKLYGDAIQFPDKIGILAIKTIADYFKGRKVPAVVPVPVGIWIKDSR